MHTPHPESVKMAGPVTLLKRAIVFYKRHSADFIKIISPQVFVALVTILILSVFAFLPPMKLEVFLLTVFVVGAGLVVQFLSSIALIQRFRDAEKGIPFPGIKASLRQASPLFFPYLWVSILIALVTLSGHVLLVIPGIILMVFLSFSIFTLVFEGERGLRALSSSWYYVKNNWWKVFGRLMFAVLIGVGVGVVYGVVTVLIYVISNHGFGTPEHMSVFFTSRDNVSLEIFGVITGLLNIFVIVPVFFVYFYEMYKEIKITKLAYSSVVEGGIRTWCKVLAIIGAILFPIVLVGCSIAIGLGAVHKNPNILIEQGFIETYDNGDVSFNYPKGWGGISTDAGLSLMNQSGAYFFLTKNTLNADVKNASAEVLGARLVASLKEKNKADKQFEIYGTTTDMKVGGVQAFRVLFVRSSEQTKGVRMLSEVTLVPYNGSMYLIELTDTEQGMAASEDQYMFMLNSLKFR